MNKEEFKKRQNITEEQYQRYLNLPEQRLKRWLIFRLERWMKKVWGYNTFWKWYPRYVKHGIEGIKKPKKHIRKNLGRVPEKYALRAIELKKKNPKWGRRTIASVIRRENNNNVISPGGVQKVLERVGLWNKIMSTFCLIKIIS